MDKKEYTPAAGFRFLTPIYDVGVGLLTCENRWRNELLNAVDPRPSDTILDVGCGTGSFLVRMATTEPAATLIGIDPDPDALEIARRKLNKEEIDTTLINGFLDDDAVKRIGTVTKVVSSLVFHQTPLDEKSNILRVMRAILEDGGSLHIADYGLQRTKLMRALFRLTIQNIDGISDTQPNADGCLLELIKLAGFPDVRETRVFATPTGSISLYRASAG